MEAETLDQSADRKSQLLLAGIAINVLLLLAFCWPSLRLLGAVYNNVDSYSHGFLVPIVSAYATYELWISSRRDSFSASWLGIPILLLGILILIVGYWYYIALFISLFRGGFILSIGILFCVVGCYVVCGGLATLRVFAFPIVYFFFAIPFPSSFTQILTTKLRTLVSVISEQVFGMLGMLVYREGNILHFTTASLGVDDACSGIQSFWMLIAASVLIAYVKRTGRFETILICILAIPISIFMNTIRIVATGLLVLWFGAHFAEGWRHELCGWFAFVGGLGMVTGLACLFTHETEQISAVQPVVPGPILGVPTRKKLILMLMVAAMLSVGTIANITVTDHYALADVVESDTERKLLVEFPDNIGSHRGVEDIELTSDLQEILRPNDYLMRIYESDSSDAIELRIMYWEARNFIRQPGDPVPLTGVSVHHPDECFPAWGYTKVEEFASDIKLESIPAESVALRLFRKSGRDEFVIFWFRKEDENMPNVRYNPVKLFSLLRQSWNEPASSNVKPQYLVAVIVKSSKSHDLAKSVALEFVEEIAPILPEFGIN